MKKIFLKNRKSSPFITLKNEVGKFLMVSVINLYP